MIDCGTIEVPTGEGFWVELVGGPLDGKRRKVRGLPLTLYTGDQGELTAQPGKGRLVYQRRGLIENGCGRHRYEYDGHCRRGRSYAGDNERLFAFTLWFVGVVTGFTVAAVLIQVLILCGR